MFLKLEATNALAFVLVVLASWRLSSLLVYEEGPFSLFLQLRRLLVRWRMVGLATCHHCASVWISALVVLMAFESTRMLWLLVAGVAGGVSALERALGGGVDQGE